MSVDVYEVICKIVHLTVRTLSYVCKPAHFLPAHFVRHHDLLSSVSQNHAGSGLDGSASNQLTSGSLLGQPYFGSLRFTYGPLRPTSVSSVPYPVRALPALTNERRDKRTKERAG